MFKQITTGSWRTIEERALSGRPQRPNDNHYLLILLLLLR